MRTKVRGEIAGEHRLTLGDNCQQPALVSPEAGDALSLPDTHYRPQHSPGGVCVWRAM